MIKEVLLMAKINISIDDGLLERIDKVAELNYMSRSGLISVACAQYINSSEVVSAVKEMALCIRKIADDGTVDKETAQQLDDMERLCKMLVSLK